MADDLVEASMNFDMENVGAFLRRISSFIESGFGSAEIDRITSLVETMGHDEEHECTFEIMYKGQRARFRISIVMDDIHAPDLYFFGPSALARQIDAEMADFAEELGI